MRYYREHDGRIPVTSIDYVYEGSTHRYVGFGNELRAWVYCLDCDAHVTECTENPRYLELMRIRRESVSA